MTCKKTKCLRAKLIGCAEAKGIFCYQKFLLLRKESIKLEKQLSMLSMPSKKKRSASTLNEFWSVGSESVEK